MSIHVTDFKWEKGNNDLQYIELLEKTLKNEQAITAKAVAKIRELSVENSELHNEAQAERAFLTERDAEIRATAIEEFAEKLKYELNGNIIPDNEKFTYARKQQEQICHQNITLKRAIKYVDYIAEQLKGGAE